MPAHKCFLLLALSMVLSVFLRIPYFQHNFIFVDEAWWANGANVLHNGGQLYIDIALDKNPPIFWFCAFLFSLFGSSMHAIHAGALFLVCLTSVLVFMLGLRFFSAGVGAAAALIHAVASTTYYIPRIIGMNTETLMVVFSTAAAYCYLLGMLHGRFLGFFFAGLFASFAFLTKPVAIAEMIFLVLFMIFAGGGVRSRLRPLAVLVAGFGLGLGLFLAYLWRTGILLPWWDQAILYGFRYVGRIGAEAFLVKSIMRIAGFGLIFAWLFMLIWLGRRTKREDARAYKFAFYWMLSAFVGVAIGRRYYANYFIQLMPPLSLLAGIGLVQLWRLRRREELRLIRRICLAAFTISFLWFHCRTLANWGFLAFPRLPREVRLWNMWQEGQRHLDIARHLKSRTSAGDRIFIWGSNPQLYFLANRSMATKWMDFDVADDYPPRAAERHIQAQTAEILRKNPPRYVVDVQQSARIENYPHFRSLIETRYYLEIQIAGARLYRLRMADP